MATFNKSVTMANGASVSATALDLTSATINDGQYTEQRPFVLGTIILPVSFAGNQLNFKVSADGITYYDLYDANGGLYTVVAGASRAVKLDSDDWKEHRYVKILSATDGVAENQTGARTLTALLFPL